MSGLLIRQQASLVMIDVQERFSGVIPEWSELIERGVRLAKFFRRLDLPIFLTEQYPKGLGRTVPELTAVLNGIQPLEKMSFSCCGNTGSPTDADAELLRRLDVGGRRQVVLCGIETHVCVLQTAIHLREAGYEVFVATDAVASRLREHRDGALARLAQAGVTLVNHESVLFELLRSAADPAFKELSRLVR